MKKSVLNVSIKGINDLKKNLVKESFTLQELGLKFKEKDIPYYLELPRVLRDMGILVSTKNKRELTFINDEPIYVQNIVTAFDRAQATMMERNQRCKSRPIAAKITTQQVISFINRVETPSDELLDACANLLRKNSYKIFKPTWSEI